MPVLLNSVIALFLSTQLAIAQERDGWHLVWADEFSTDGLPDPTKWMNEVGFIRNKELQYYTEKRSHNARVEAGRLIIEAHCEAFKNPKYKPESTQWYEAEKARFTSASLTTKKSFELLFGRVEVRAKLPRGRGVWPAIWMLGTNIDQIGWPKCGEIDILEAVGFEPDKVFANVHWYSEADQKHLSSGGKLIGQAPSDDFHVYALEWKKDRMDFYYDETLYHSFPLKKADNQGGNAFLNPQYLLINLAIGGGWGGAKGVDETIFPQRYEIDYVRFYQAR